MGIKAIRDTMLGGNLIYPLRRWARMARGGGSHCRKRRASKDMVKTKASGREGKGDTRYDARRQSGMHARVAGAGCIGASAAHPTI